MSGLAEADFALCELPPMLRELVDVAGFAATVALAERFGGTEIVVPAREPGPEWIVWQCAGGEAAGKIWRRYQGLRVYIPKGDRALRCVRNRQIVEAYRGDATANRLAREFGLSSRRVSDILNNPDSGGAGDGRRRRDPRQLAMEI
ncbi:hypothetical protein SIID45300_01765 [Candidatus Magnetaquicoccaceae bacterium FCR-1]|uniref:Mor transcription activator domain-containing protein n=2 Tax=Candidatus Magnetaquiglobus chichijimensis TaxID=3141448 RepID=A0ABQ0C975_9PROT